MLYRKLKDLGNVKVYLSRPPDKEPLNVWECRPQPYWLENVGKRKSRVREHYSPRTNAMSVSNKRIVEHKVWDEARDRWEKERIWKTLTKI